MWSAEILWLAMPTGAQQKPSSTLPAEGRSQAQQPAQRPPPQVKACALRMQRKGNLFEFRLWLKIGQKGYPLAMLFFLGSLLAPLHSTKCH